jgi:hypothetical protein
MVAGKRRAGRIRADKTHQGAGGRIGAAAPAMRVDGGVEAGQPPVELTQTGSLALPAGEEIMPPEIDRRSSSLSSDDFAGFLLGAGFALLDGFCLWVGIRFSSLAMDARGDGGRRWNDGASR